MEPSSASVVRTKKRKLEDALRTLDGVVRVSPSLTNSVIERPTQSKRPHVTRSVYSTLAKFSAAPRQQPQPLANSTPSVDVSKSAPRLAAILARSASRSKRAPPLIHPLTIRASEYRPSSTDSFLSRLSTFKITTYANKPPQIDAVSAAKCGWINDGKDRLLCGMCDASWVLAGREGMNKDAASALVEKQRVYLVAMHKDGCPWKTRQCESSVYRVPLQAPSVMVRELGAIALSLDPLLKYTAIKHPLTPSQLSSLYSIFSAVSERQTSRPDSTMDTDETTDRVVPSNTAITVALFGWIPAPIAKCNERRHTFFSISRAGSPDPSVSAPSIPSLSCASPVSNQLRQRASTPALSVSPGMSISQFTVSPDRIGASSRMKDPWSNNTATDHVPRDALLVYCPLCQRRVGLWRYTKNDVKAPLVWNKDSATTIHEHQKEFDVVKEHRSYCPYVTRSSVVPSFSHSLAVDSPGNVIEGWRAVLTIVQRYQLGRRQHLSRFLPSDDLGTQVSALELQGVEAMVAGVKTNGGRELLKYVKGILG